MPAPSNSEKWGRRGLRVYYIKQQARHKQAATAFYSPKEIWLSDEIGKEYHYLGTSYAILSRLMNPGECVTSDVALETYIAQPRWACVYPESEDSHQANHFKQLDRQGRGGYNFLPAVSLSNPSIPEPLHQQLNLRFNLTSYLSTNVQAGQAGAFAPDHHRYHNHLPTYLPIHSPSTYKCIHHLQSTKQTQGLYNASQSPS